MQAPNVNRGRRAIISVGIISFCLLFNAYLALSGHDSTLVTHVSDGFFSIAELVVMFYIGGSVIDSTNIAGIFGNKRWGSFGGGGYNDTSYGGYGSYGSSYANPEPIPPQYAEDDLVFPEAPEPVKRRTRKGT